MFMLLLPAVCHIKFGSSNQLQMKKKQYQTLAIAMLACWLVLAFAFFAGGLTPNAGARTSFIEFNTGNQDEVPGPFTLKAVSTFLLQ